MVRAAKRRLPEVTCLSNSYITGGINHTIEGKLTQTLSNFRKKGEQLRLWGLTLSLSAEQKCIL
jgi:hypothetical protein